MAEKKGRTSRKAVDKWKKKKWFTILASRIFNKKPLGEIPGEKTRNVLGRTISIGLDQLTGQRAKRDTTVTFKVSDVQGQNAVTSLTKFEVKRTNLKRMARRRSSKVGVVDKIPVKEGDARITLVAITANKATGSQKTGVRKIISEELLKLKGKEFEDVVQELLFGNTTNNIFKKSKKVCLMKKVIAAKAKFIEAK